MAKTIEAKAIISAADQTGATFDKVANKMKSIEKAAKSFEGIKGPQKFFGNFNEELERLKLSEKELQSVRKSFGELDRALKSQTIGAANYFRAIDEWKGKTVDHWREVKASVNEAEVAHKRFFKTAGHFARHTAAHVVGGFGAAYVAGHAIKSVIEAAAARNRGEVRYDQMGLTPGQYGEANVVADSISSRFPSLSRTDVIDDLRKNTSRLGSFDRAKEIADVYARARIMNKLSGGDEHELEQVVRAAEGAGAANTPEQFGTFLNAYSKQKARNPDYTGEDFAKDFRAAGAAKYGLGKDYMENIFPVLASHTPGFGVKLGTSNSALIGGRMTKQSKAAMEAAGLWKDGKLVDATGYQANPFEWTQQHIKPLLEAKGVHFSEHMSEEDKRTTSAFASRTFSAKNTADQIITNLLDASLVEKAGKMKTRGLESVPDLQTKDADIALEGFTTQAKDAGTALMGMKFVVSQLNQESQRLANFTNYLRTGEMPDKPNPYATALGLPEHRGMTPSQRNEYDNAQGTVAEFNSRLFGTDGDQSPGVRRAREKLFEAQQKVWATQNMENMPPVFSAAESERWQQQFPARDDSYYANARHATFDGDRAPLPMADPRRGAGSGMPPVQGLEGANVQATLTGSADVAGSIDVNVKVEAGSSLIAVENSVKSLVAKVSGMLHTNGPGSTGKSSPDGAAPMRPSTGATGGW